MECKLTLVGAINYFDALEAPLFEDLILPEGLNKDSFIYTLVEHAGEMPLLYMDLDYMKAMIPKWGKKWERTFIKWKEALDLKYAPIENYDRMEDSTDSVIGKGQNISNNKVSAFNSDTMRDDSENSGLTEFDNASTRKSHIHGNIGVTTSQQMLEAEFDIAEWNVYEHMADIFIEAFMVPVY